MKTAKEWIEQLLLKPVPVRNGPRVSKQDIEAIQRDAYEHGVSVGYSQCRETEARNQPIVHDMGQ